VGVAIGTNEMPQSFVAATPTGVSFSRPVLFRWVSGGKPADADTTETLFKELNEPEDTTGRTLDENDGGSIGMISGGGSQDNSNPLDFLQRTALDAQLSSDKIIEISKKFQSAVPYPKGALADSLSLVGRMIAGGLPTRVYYVSQGGYDTHTNEVATHNRLMTELSAGLAAFAADLKAQGNLNRVMLMTFSEFGRRVAQNASNGTDHGAAAPMFVMGGGIKAGLFGKYPSLTNLNGGDLIYNVDFRSVYATILEKWLKAPSQVVLGKKFPLMGIV
jgi:hypothetical protein